MKDFRKTFISPNASIEDALRAIQEGGGGITVVVDAQDRLIGTITDGDVRRAILRKVALTEPVSLLLANRPADYPQPVTALVDTPHEQILSLMEFRMIRQVPLLDPEGRVRDVALLSDLMEEEHHLPVIAVIMAGGRGQRLFPLTQHIPKPMLLLDDSPILERIVCRLKNAGIRKIYISTNYKSEVIQHHFGDGGRWGVAIDYLHEDRPLGTAGALTLMEEPPPTTLVINGDILTDLNFHVMYEFHRSHHADITVGVRIYENEIPYGVIETDDIHIKKLVEKPMQACIINAGIYMLDASAYQWLTPGQRCDMTTLLEALIKDQRKVISFPIQEYWIDVGQPTDYERAKLDFKNGRV